MKSVHRPRPGPGTSLSPAASYWPKLQAIPDSDNEEIVSAFNGRSWKPKGMSVGRHGKMGAQLNSIKMVMCVSPKFRNFLKVTWLVSIRDRI